jgi:hypothetical protein
VIASFFLIPPSEVIEGQKENSYGRLNQFFPRIPKTLSNKSLVYLLSKNRSNLAERY